MRWFLNSHLFNHSWEAVSSANWIKYPNEITPHVIHVDYLSRFVDPVTGILHTERLITCRQTVPDFVLKLIGGSSEAYIYEHSECDPHNRTLTLKTKNLTFCSLMNIEETCVYSPSPADLERETQFTQEVKISSLNSWAAIRNYLEDFGSERFKANAIRGKQALEQALSKICQETRGAMGLDIEDNFPDACTRVTSTSNCQPQS